MSDNQINANSMTSRGLTVGDDVHATVEYDAAGNPAIVVIVPLGEAVNAEAASARA